MLGDPFKEGLAKIALAHSGWTKGERLEGATGILADLHESFGLVPKIDPAATATLGGPEFSRGDVKSLIGQLRNLEVAKRSPGIKHLESFVHRMNELQVNAGYRVMGAGTNAPYIQMEVGPGGQIINLPFELSRGRVTMGTSTYVGRQHISAAGTRTSFSRHLYESIIAATPGGARPVEQGRAIQAAIKSTSRGMLEGTRIFGREMLSRLEVKGHQALFAQGHPLASLREQALSSILAAQQGGNLPDVSSKLAVAKAHALNFSEQVYNAGFSMEGIKWENVSKHMVANLPDVQLYPGVLLGDLHKGVHQLLGREALTPQFIKGIGFRRPTPEIMSIGARTTFEVGMRTGVIMGNTATRAIGDSAAWIKSRRAKRLIQGFPLGRSLEITAPARYGEAGYEEVGRRLGPAVESALREAGAFAELERTGTWQAEKPIFIKGASLPGGRRVPTVLGQSVGTTGAGEIVPGKVRTIPGGMGISSVSRTIRSVGGRHEAVYKFGLTKRPGVTEAGRGLLVGGTVRVAGLEFLKPGTGRAYEPDIIVRAQEAFKNRQVKQTLLGSHWLRMARRSRHLDFSEVAGAMGLRAGKFGDDITAFGLNEWELTHERARAVRGIFLKALQGAGFSNVQARAWMRRHFLGHKAQLSAQDMRDIASAHGSLAPEIIRSLKRHGMRVFEAGPTAVRAGVGGGLKPRYGIRLRMEHATMALMRMASDGSPADVGVEAHAKLLTQAFQQHIGAMSPEAANVLGPRLAGGLNVVKGAQRVSLGKYAKTFNAIPALRGGVAPGALAGTILSPGFGGAVVDLPFGVEMYEGSVAGTVAGKSTSVLTTRQLWLPSVAIDPVKEGPGGIIHSNRSLALRRKLDLALRSGAGAGPIGRLYSAYMVSLKDKLFGKKGRMVPRLRPELGSYARLGLYSAAPEYALDIGFTEERIRAMAGKNKQLADDIIWRLKSGGEVFMSAYAEPTHGPQHFVPAMRLRLVEHARVAAAGMGRIGTRDLALLGQGAITMLDRDLDLDTIFTFLAGGKLDPALQKQARAVWERDLAIYQHGLSLAESATKASGSIFGGKMRGRASAWAQLATDKFGIPIPDLFFRHRMSLIDIANRAGRGDVEALTQAKRMGLGDYISRLKITPKQASAAAAVKSMIQQRFIGKGAKDAMAMINAIRGVKTGSQKEVTKLTGKIHTLLRVLAEEGKYRPPVVGGGNMSLLEVASEAATALVRSEGALKATNTRDFFNSALYAVRGDTKSAEQIARVLGADLDPNIEPHENRALREKLAKFFRVDIKSINEEIKGSAASKPSHIKTVLQQKGVLGAAGDILARTWKGETFLGPKWGKGVLGVGAFLLAKGLYDVGAGADELPSTEGGGHTPAVTPIPAGYQPPSFAMVGDTSIRLENPTEQAFRVKGTVNENNMLDFRELGNKIIMASGGRPGGYGYIEDRNLPLDENEMEIYLREKMRSSF